MSLILCLLLGPDPPLSDLDRLGFPDHAVCARQAELYRAHALYLRYRRSASGYEGGRWDWWVRENARGLECWELLAAATSEGGPAGPVPPKVWRGMDWTLDTRRGHLRQYRDLVGAPLYYAGHHPPIYPEPAPPPVMPTAAGANNAAP